MKSSSHLQSGILLLLLGAATILGLCVVVAATVLAPQGRVSCASFATCSDARDGYKKGAYWLDGDNDHKLCEDRFSGCRVEGEIGTAAYTH